MFQLVLDAMAEGLLINCSYDVDRAVKVLAKIFKRFKPEAAGTVVQH